MCTFAITISSHPRRDGKRRVYIRVTWKRKSAYIPTEYYLPPNEITRTRQPRSVRMVRELQERIAAYEEEKALIGIAIWHMSAKELAERFKNATGQCGTLCDLVAYAGKVASAKSAGTARLVRYVAEDLRKRYGTLNAENVTPQFLERWKAEMYSEGCSDNTAILRLSTLRMLWNSARRELDPYNQRLRLDPWDGFTMPRRPVTKKRNLSPSQIAAILTAEPADHSERTALDAFTASLCLCGMNLADLCELEWDGGGRITYRRKKTRNRRADGAEISVPVPEEAAAVLPRLLGKLHGMQAGRASQVVNRGLHSVGRRLGMPSLTLYYARHSWATIARNDCGFAVSDVAECLNHTSGHSITDTYINRDWHVVDAASAAVLSVIRAAVSELLGKKTENDL